LPFYTLKPEIPKGHCFFLFFSEPPKLLSALLYYKNGVS
jgi:hypothetical protein